MQKKRTVKIIVTDHFGKGLKRTEEETWTAEDMEQCKCGVAQWMWNGFYRLGKVLDRKLEENRGLF